MGSVHRCVYRVPITGVFNKILGALSSDTFGGTSFGTITTLSTLTNANTFMATGFTYDASGTGELASVTAPYGGYLRWTYANDTLTGGTVRQVQYRYVAMSAGASENAHQLVRYDSGVPTHGIIGMYDVGGQPSRVWYMQSNIAAASVGLVVAYQESSWGSGPDTFLKQNWYTWSQHPSGNQYISQVVTTLDPGPTNAKHKTSNQTVDQYRNLTSLQITDFNGAVRTYYNGYLTDANDTSRYMLNRLTGSSVTGGGQTSTFVSNSYDQFGQLDVSGMQQHDPAYGYTLPYRGNATTSVTPGGTTTRYVDIGGNV